MKSTSFNGGWFFYSKDDPAKKIPVRLPHDAMQLEERIPNLKNGPLVAEYPGGDYYYEKTIYGDPALDGKCVLLEFGGVFMDSHIYLNGEEISGHIYGYSNFYVDLTDKLKITENNELLVYVHNSQTPNSRWYSGSGIYRPVRMLVGEKEHIEPDGVKVITKSYDPAVIAVTVESNRQADTEVLTEIFFDGEKVAEGKGAACEIEVPDAKLWDDEHPNLYQFRVSLIRDGVVIDTNEQRFGIRYLEWDGRKGFLVNGKSVKLRGGCVHHDNGILGAREFKEAELRRMRKLKEGGFNAVRGAHDPRSREFLEACDEVGMYVMAEAFDVWFGSTGVYGYALVFNEEWEKDLTQMIKTCYNHPSVIMYSVGNEISETATEKGVEYGRLLVDVCHRLDDSRPVTMGINLMLNVLQNMNISLAAGQEECKITDEVDPKRTEPDNKMNGSVMINTIISLFKALTKVLNAPSLTDKATKGIFSVLDIAGYNYGLPSYKKHHELYPERVIVGSETNPSDTVERIKATRELTHVIGDFAWTAWDYLGECGAGIIDYNKSTGGYNKPYPAIIAGCGLYDLIGHRDTMAYDWAIAWGLCNTHIAVSDPKHYRDKLIPALYRSTDAIDSWSFSGWEGKPVKVRVASSGKRVELFLNGVSKGKKRVKNNLALFDTTYASGTIEAVSYDSAGREIGRDRLVSANRETVINATADKNILKADGDDITFVDIAFTDHDGIVKPLNHRVNVTVEGPGELLAIGSGAPRVTDKYISDSFEAYHGRLACVVRTMEGQAGEIKIRLHSDVTEDAELILQVV